jgi:hypothetical protein
MSNPVIYVFEGSRLALNETELAAARQRYVELIAAPAPSGAAERVKLVGADAAARALNVSERLIADLTRAGILPHHRIGERAIRYDLAEIAAATRSSGAAIPGTDAATNGSPIRSANFGLMNQGVARAVSRKSPGNYPAGGRGMQPRRNREATAPLVEKRGET